MVWRKIPIEARSPDEVTCISAVLNRRTQLDSSADVLQCVQLSPRRPFGFNPAFDVPPAGWSLDGSPSGAWLRRVRRGFARLIRKNGNQQERLACPVGLALTPALPAMPDATPLVGCRCPLRRDDHYGARRDQRQSIALRTYSAPRLWVPIPTSCPWRWTTTFGEKTSCFGLLGRKTIPGVRVKGSGWGSGHPGLLVPSIHVCFVR